MQAYTFEVRAGATDVDPNTTLNPNRRFDVPRTLFGTDAPPRQALGATNNGAAETITVQLWSFVEPSGGWVLLSTITLTAIDRVAKLAVPNDAGAPAVAPGPMYARVTTAPAADTKLVIQLAN